MLHLKQKSSGPCESLFCFNAAETPMLTETSLSKNATIHIPIHSSCYTNISYAGKLYPSIKSGRKGNAARDAFKYGESNGGGLSGWNRYYARYALG